MCCVLLCCRAATRWATCRSNLCPVLPCCCPAVLYAAALLCHVLRADVLLRCHHRWPTWHSTVHTTLCGVLLCYVLPCCVLLRRRDVPCCMLPQVGDLAFNADGLAQRGVLLRHLAMPGLLQEGKDILSWVAKEVSPDT